MLKACGAVFVKFSLGGSEFRLAMTSGAGSISKVGAKIPAHSAGNFFLLCLPPPDFFVVPPMTEQSAGHSNKD